MWIPTLHQEKNKGLNRPLRQKVFHVGADLVVRESGLISLFLVVILNGVQSVNGMGRAERRNKGMYLVEDGTEQEKSRRRNKRMMTTRRSHFSGSFFFDSFRPPNPELPREKDVYLISTIAV
jgi:hypothetical protein